MMFTTAFAALLFGAVTQVAHAAPANAARDVFTPPILDPHNGTVWTYGERRNVTWSTDNIPVNITGGDNNGRLALRFANIETPVLLAWDFNVRLGYVEVAVPAVFTGDDYSLVFFGDSGDFSEDFTIVGPE